MPAPRVSEDAAQHPPPEKALEVTSEKASGFERSGRRVLGSAGVVTGGWERLRKARSEPRQLSILAAALLELPRLLSQSLRVSSQARWCISPFGRSQRN